MCRHRGAELLDGAEPRNGVRQGHIIRYNLIAVATDRGIYLDNYTSNCHVYGNVVIGTKTAAIFVHGGRNNLIENNVLVNCGNPLIEGMWIDRFMPAMAGFLGGHRFAHNIVYGWPGDGRDLRRACGPGTFASRRERLFRYDGRALYLERQRQIGLESRSLVANPKFVNPAEQDYRLQPDSPALRLGFEPIDFQRIGPRTHDARLALAPNPESRPLRQLHRFYPVTTAWRRSRGRPGGCSDRRGSPG